MKGNFDVKYTKKTIHMQSTARNLDFMFHLALKLNKTTFLLINLETSRLRHFEALEYPIEVKLWK